jgi:hypothetical protein
MRPRGSRILRTRSRGDRMTVYPVKKPRRKSKRTPKPIPRSRVKPVNAARKRREFARCYYSQARVEFVKSLPCAVCGVVGLIENAHVGGVEGMRRKGSYLTIAPLCGPWTLWTDDKTTQTDPGCHAMHHASKAFREQHAAALAHACLDTEARWQAFSGGAAATESN